MVRVVVVVVVVWDGFNSKMDSSTLSTKMTGYSSSSSFECEAMYEFKHWISLQQINVFLSLVVLYLTERERAFRIFHVMTDYYKVMVDMNCMGPHLYRTKRFYISLFDCRYQQMCLDNKLLLELQSIGLYPNTGEFSD